MNKDDGKPKLHKGSLCPTCKSEDTVGLRTDECFVGWCSCGVVWTDAFSSPSGAEAVHNFRGRRGV